MTWFFLSAFADALRNVGKSAVTVQEICEKDDKFNYMYIKDKKTTEKLYTKFMQTKTYRNFLSSSSFSNLFN